MNFISQLDQSLDAKHLLKHPFYQAWTAGELTQDYLKTYAEQYFHHVAAFPRYISAAHANCDNIQARQVLLENLCDEELGDEHHPELWLRFAEGIGATRHQVQDAELLPETQQLINTFMQAAKSSYAEGVGALYAYERQIPTVAQSKIDGLQKFYGITAEETLKFFQVHLAADVHHSNATRDLLVQLPAAEQDKASAAAYHVADALWQFLTGMQRVTFGESSNDAACAA